MEGSKKTKAQLIGELETVRSRLAKFEQVETKRKRAEEALQTRTNQLAAVTEAMSAFVTSGDWHEASARILRSALRQTESEYGFIGVVVDGPALRILAHEGIVWDADLGRDLYEEALRTYERCGFLEFTSFENLFGTVVREAKSLISNEPSNDPRSGGRPPGHPALRHFLGVPVLKGSQVVGLICVANRSGGYTGNEQGKIEILCRAASVLYDSYRQRQREDALEQERKRAEEALRESQSRLQLALDALDGGVWEWDLKTDNVYLSPRWSRMLGYEPGEFEPRPTAWEDRLHPEDKPRVRQLLNDYLEGKTPTLYSEHRLKTKSGEWVWVLGRGQVVARDENGRPQRMTGTEIDISVSKRVEKERERLLARERQALKAAQAASRAKDEFLATLSHELRTPLHAIIGWLDLVRSGAVEADEVNDVLERIERNAHAQNRLIEDILEVSRIIQGKFQLELRACDPAAILESALDSVRPAAAMKSIQLRSLLERTDPILADESRLQQVLWNLLSNAIKFSERDARIEVRLQASDSQVDIMISDTGSGISPEFLPHVFERFRQGDGSTTRQHRGLGLGLAIVRHLVELHGGTVEAESEGEGKGATFTVTLPVVAAPFEHADARPVERLKLPSTIPLRVLAVDDDAESRDLLQKSLRHFGMEVLTVASAAEAIETLRTWMPDVLVSDIAMPGEDGYSLIRKIRAREPELGGQIPALALTAFAGAEQSEKLLRAGFQLHLSKPIEPKKLVSVLAELASASVA